MDQELGWLVVLRPVHGSKAESFRMLLCKSVKSPVKRCTVELQKIFSRPITVLRTERFVASSYPLHDFNRWESKRFEYRELAIFHIFRILVACCPRCQPLWSKEIFTPKYWWDASAFRETLRVLRRGLLHRIKRNMISNRSVLNSTQRGL